MSNATKLQCVRPRVVIDQSDMYTHVFNGISEHENIGSILLIYLNSLAKRQIAAQQDISKLIIFDLVRNKRLDTLRKLIEFSLINESKSLAHCLLSLSNVHPSIAQMALDMLNKLNNADNVSLSYDDILFLFFY